MYRGMRLADLLHYAADLRYLHHHAPGAAMTARCHAQGVAGYRSVVRYLDSGRHVRTITSPPLRTFEEAVAETRLRVAKLRLYGVLLPPPRDPPCQ